MKNNRIIRYIIVLACVLSGCTLFLPRQKTVTTTPWKSFDEAKAAYEKIDVNKATTTQIRKYGFNIYSTQNVRILNYLDIATTTQSLKPEELSEGLAACLKAKNNCRAYVFEPKVISSKRYGNFWLDFFNFKRKTRNTGWRFGALFVVVDDIVIEKFWSGDPMVDEDDQKTNPLGPLQDGADRAIRFVPWL